LLRDGAAGQNDHCECGTGAQTNAPTSAHRDRFRANIILRRLDGLKIESIAKQLKTSMPTVSNGLGASTHMVSTALMTKSVADASRRFHRRKSNVLSPK
jgi:hypothetical protein